jgi:hypothetical protein
MLSAFEKNIEKKEREESGFLHKLNMFRVKCV